MREGEREGRGDSFHGRWWCRDRREKVLGRVNVSRQAVVG